MFFLLFLVICLKIKFGNIKTNIVSLHRICENSSVGRARPCQGRGRGFESRFSLNFLKQRAKRASFVFFIKMFPAQMVELVDTLVSGTSGRKPVQVRVLFWVQRYFKFQDFKLAYAEKSEI